MKDILNAEKGSPSYSFPPRSPRSKVSDPCPLSLWEREGVRAAPATGNLDHADPVMHANGDPYSGNLTIGRYVSYLDFLCKHFTKVSSATTEVLRIVCFGCPRFVFTVEWQGREAEVITY